MTKRAVIIQHHPVETLGANFTAILRDGGFEIATVPVYEGAPDFADFDAPDVSDVDLVVALGGPMSANDNYSALIQEMAYLRAAATGDVGNREPTPVVGICLGAQLLSRALGGAVAPTGGYQFGLRKITLPRAADPTRPLARSTFRWRPRCMESSSPCRRARLFWLRAPCFGETADTFVCRWRFATGRPTGSSLSHS